MCKYNQNLVKLSSFARNNNIVYKKKEFIGGGIKDNMTTDLKPYDSTFAHNDSFVCGQTKAISTSARWAKCSVLRMPVFISEGGIV